MVFWNGLSLGKIRLYYYYYYYYLFIFFCPEVLHSPRDLEIIKAMCLERLLLIHVGRGFDKSATKCYGVEALYCDRDPLKNVAGLSRFTRS